MIRILGLFRAIFELQNWRQEFITQAGRTRLTSKRTDIDDTYGLSIGYPLTEYLNIILSANQFKFGDDKIKGIVFELEWR